MTETHPRHLRILVVGASGTLGDAVITELGPRHRILRAGPHESEFCLDLADPVSIVSAISSAGKLDAVICAAGNVNFTPMSEIKPATVTDSVYGLGLTHKLLGQVNLVLAARDHLNPGGSITLTAGTLSTDPIFAGTAASMVNGAIESFVRAAAIELPHGIRINAVSPSILIESLGKFGEFFRGVEPVPAARAALAFSRSVEGHQTGQVYRVV